jgi:hypothetical protein
MDKIKKNYKIFDERVKGKKWGWNHKKQIKFISHLKKIKKKKKSGDQIWEMKNLTRIKF